MKLSKYFRLKEMHYSATALCEGIINTAGETEREIMRNLCQKVLEPLREWYGQPILVTSGYRCKDLNTAVRGVPNSQHMKGEAADIVPLYYDSLAKRNAVMMEWFEWMQEHLRFDQLILERDRRDSRKFWIHVSLCRDDQKNRQQVLKGVVKK